MALRVAVGNHKGGSGKTAWLVNVAAALSELGARVLVVDMDPQANASRRLAARFDPKNPVLTTSEIVASGEPGVAAQAIRHCGWPEPYRSRIDVIPARIDLDNRINEAPQLGSVLRLATALEGVDDDYDVTLFDCQPSLAHLTQLVLAAAVLALAVADPEFDGVDGAIRYMDFVASEANRRGLSNPGLRPIGVVINRSDSRVGAHRFQLTSLPETFEDHVMVWEPIIPERAVIKDAADSELPLALLPSSAQARAVAEIFTAHARQLLKHKEAAV